MNIKLLHCTYGWYFLKYLAFAFFQDHLYLSITVLQDQDIFINISLLKSIYGW